MIDTSFEDLILERADSPKQSHEIVPEDMKFTFRLKNEAGKSYRLFEYVLPVGKLLPHSVIYKEKQVSFDKYLTPSILGMNFLEVKLGHYIFQDQGEMKIYTAEISSFNDDYICLGTNKEQTVNPQNNKIVYDVYLDVADDDKLLKDILLADKDEESS